MFITFLEDEDVHWIDVHTSELVLQQQSTEQLTQSHATTEKDLAEKLDDSASGNNKL